jgi:hypothetical protein
LPDIKLSPNCRPVPLGQNEPGNYQVFFIVLSLHSRWLLIWD